MLILTWSSLESLPFSKGAKALQNASASTLEFGPGPAGVEESVAGVGPVPPARRAPREVLDPATATKTQARTNRTDIFHSFAREQSASLGIELVLERGLLEQFDDLSKFLGRALIKG